MLGYLCWPNGVLWQEGLGVRESKKSPWVGLGSLNIFTNQQGCADPVSYTVLAPRP